MTKAELDALADKVARKLFDLMQEQNDTYLDSDEASAFLKMSKQTLYNKRNEIPRVKRDGKVRYSKQALIRYIQNQ